jgi:cbb3-type cytochrome oxidase subunit 3
MSLMDVMSSLHLSVYPQVALVIFLGVFVGVCFSLIGQKTRFEQSAKLPLDDAQTATPNSPSTNA